MHTDYLDAKLIVLALVIGFHISCNESEPDKFKFYSGEWSEVEKVEEWAGFGQFDHRNTLDVEFDKKKTLGIFQDQIKVKVSYKNKGDSILARYKSLENKKTTIKYPWKKISNEEPIFILHKLSQNRNALFLEWKGFYSEEKNLDVIWARQRAIKHPPGATLEGIYLRPLKRKNGDKEVKLKERVERKLLSKIILGKRVDIGMSEYDMSEEIVTRPDESRLSRLLTYRFKATDTELRTIGVRYNEGGVSYIQSRPSAAGETFRYSKLLRTLGATKMSKDKVDDRGVDKYFGFRHNGAIYTMLISKGGESMFRIKPVGRIE